MPNWAYVDDGAGGYFATTGIITTGTLWGTWATSTTSTTITFTPPDAIANLLAYTPYTIDGQNIYAEPVWQPLDYNPPVQLNPEDAERLQAELVRQAEARQQQATARQQEFDERARLRAEATERATELLLALLNEHQREQYEARHSFEVVGSHGTRYRINRGTAGNVEWLTPDGVVGGQMCAHPTMRGNWLPEPDVHIGQMLALQTDEVAFVQLANMYYGRRPELATA